jgi:hypothetical protein
MLTGSLESLLRRNIYLFDLTINKLRLGLGDHAEINSICLIFNYCAVNYSEDKAGTVNYIKLQYIKKVIDKLVRLGRTGIYWQPPFLTINDCNELYNLSNFYSNKVLSCLDN